MPSRLAGGGGLDFGRPTSVFVVAGRVVLVVVAPFPFEGSPGRSLAASGLMVEAPEVDPVLVVPDVDPVFPRSAGLPLEFPFEPVPTPVETAALLGKVGTFSAALRGLSDG